MFTNTITKAYTVLEVTVINAAVWVALLFGPTTTPHPTPTIHHNQTRLDVAEPQQYD